MISSLPLATHLFLLAVPAAVAVAALAVSWLDQRLSPRTALPVPARVTTPE
jgi:hypothetical protein